MKLELPLERMTVDEKLEAMEILWADLARHSPDEAAPNWHGDVLAERERRLVAGKEQIVDWEEAKKRLLQETRDAKNS